MGPCFFQAATHTFVCNLKDFFTVQVAHIHKWQAALINNNMLFACLLHSGIRAILCISRYKKFRGLCLSLGYLLTKLTQLVLVVFQMAENRQACQMWALHGSTSSRGTISFNICFECHQNLCSKKGQASTNSRIAGEVGGNGPLGDLSLYSCTFVGETLEFYSWKDATASWQYLASES